MAVLAFALILGTAVLPFVSGDLSIRILLSDWQLFPEARILLVLIAASILLMLYIFGQIIFMSWINARYFKRNFPDQQALDVLHLQMKRRSVSDLVTVLGKLGVAAKPPGFQLWPPILHFVSTKDGVRIAVQRNMWSTQSSVFAQVPWSNFSDVSVITNTQIPALMAVGGGTRFTESMFFVEFRIANGEEQVAFMGAGMVENGVSAMDGDEFHLERVCQHFDQTRSAFIAQQGE